jgi:hypothetical protein
MLVLSINRLFHARGVNEVNAARAAEAARLLAAAPKPEAYVPERVTAMGKKVGCQAVRFCSQAVCGF